MKISLLAVVALVFLFVAEPAQAQTKKTTTTTTKKTANGYHRTSNVRAKSRAGAYSRYDRSRRRNEGTTKLAPGLRLNMPSPPTTDYMGRPLKKPVAKAASSSSTLSSDKTPIKKTSTVITKKQ
ncbi:hypothetical protein SAMN00120144_2071 [Hymenobacter roseosalivarius DSM 11622]|uniref:Secreted protein n=1 Tax=Hymenobacter roseosalivarius DSM 11622 TaxID=645990 RepID=A0A1W1VNW6_9BACT|nr:hypothetical protein [Hymenobacter roseosalivarius]SMB94761.1 hypothetical protein SAMN00120144_2071 [Hymenobacter roseosalivarius DSM 11622]